MKRTPGKRLPKLAFPLNSTSCVGKKKLSGFTSNKAASAIIRNANPIIRFLYFFIFGFTPDPIGRDFVFVSTMNKHKEKSVSRKQRIIFHALLCVQTFTESAYLCIVAGLFIKDDRATR